MPAPKRPSRPIIVRREVYLKPEIPITHVPRLLPPELLGIEFMPDGRIRQPRFKLSELGRLEPVSFAVYKDPYTAIRATSHAIESIRSRLGRLSIVQQMLASIHATLYDNWPRMNPRQREAAKHYVFGLIDLLWPRLESSKNLGIEEREKIKRVRLEIPELRAAADRLNEAISFMEAGNIGAARAVMSEASKKIVETMKRFLKQEAHLMRRKKVYLREHIISEQKFFSTYDSLRLLLQLLSRPFPEVPREQVAEQLHKVLKTTTELSNRYAPFGDASKHLAEAMELLQRGAGLNEASARLKKAIAAIYLAGSGCVIFPKERLAELKAKGGERAKLIVAGNQLRLFADNAKYWYERARPEQRQNMLDFLRALRALITGTRAQQYVVSIAKAERALRDARPEDCKEILMPVVEKISEILKKQGGSRKE